MGMDSNDNIDLFKIYEQVTDYVDRFTTSLNDRQQIHMAYQMHRQLMTKLTTKLKGSKYQKAEASERHGYWFELFVIAKLDAHFLEWWMEDELMRGRYPRDPDDQAAHDEQFSLKKKQVRLSSAEVG